ncbi:MAG: Ig domain-containing protein, partial [Planctomycetota bacterium]
RWIPQLCSDGTVVPEATGAAPPPIPDRPKLVSIIVGVTYLIILMLVVMLPHILKMLDAVRGHSDIRTHVLEVVAREADRGDLRLEHAQPLRAQVGQPYDTAFTVAGGTPPYRWERITGRIPPGLAFDEPTATIQGTPTEPGDTVIRLRASDATTARAEWTYVISVAAPRARYPRIQDEALPAATEGEAYSLRLRVVGGQPPYRWIVNDRRLPKGLEFGVDAGGADAEGGTATLTGRPQLDTAGAHVLEFRVTDAAYSPYEDVTPWILPFAATTVCLLGFWNMRRWSVVLYALLIAGQPLVGWMAAGYPLSTSAVCLQALLWGVGVAYWQRMR